MNVKIANIEDSKRIDSYIQESPSSSLYHKYLWGVVIEKSFGHKYYSLLCEEGSEKPLGVLPLVHMKSMIFGNMLDLDALFSITGEFAQKTRCTGIF